ncbi:hypothetical protein OQH61_05440 [Helicobacter sp. MIT 21-1697]|uniref:hypothetical protein n=1 Tax=Helicobacter sp. MIT 21-1697 TaxID=2993733 RepID=UPI00224B24A8|nr:hypothetical protein [Helicobacter sp. MIT 21-1697]MCX2717177.1 hypothetical protein [Helicobacter sp. MIT 21-1697]
MNTQNDKTMRLDDIILPKSRVNEWEKEEIANVAEEAKKEQNILARNNTQGLGLYELKVAGYIMLFVFIISVPKIYLSSHIYYLSKDIANLQAQYAMLTDENRRLKHDVENLRYKFLILNEF